MRFTLGIALILCVAIVYVSADNFGNVVAQLGRYQDPQTGAFRASGKEEPTLSATAEGLFLARVYGLGSKVNLMFVNEYIESQRKGNGYGEAGAAQADIETTLNAVAAYNYLGIEVPNVDTVIGFITSLLDSNSLFAAQAGGRGNIKSTYQAIAALSALDSITSLSATTAQEISTTIRNAWNAETLRFELAGASNTESNYFALYILHSLNGGAAIIPYKQVSETIYSFQRPNGGFAASANGAQGDFESTYYSLAALELLERATNQDFTGAVDLQAFYYFARSVSGDLREAALAHKAVSYTQAFAEIFKFFVEYGTSSRGQRVVQGYPLKPELVVRAFNGPSHPGLTSRVAVTIASTGSHQTYDLEWDNDRQRYTTDAAIDTTGLIGSIVFSYSINLKVFGIGPVAFTQESEKTVGYAINIIPVATHVTGQAIKPGEAISAGTSFEFDIKLSNKTVSNLKTGDFELRLEVFESSSGVLVSETIDGRTNSDNFQFSYELKEANYVPGDFGFNFVVLGADGKAHSFESVVYELAVPLVASSITFNGQSSLSDIHLGDSLNIAVVPSSYFDFKPTALTSTNSLGENLNTLRKYFLDITTRSGTVLQTIAGVADSTSGYVFAYDIPQTFDALGPVVLSFRYVSSAGKTVQLDNYDSVEGSLYEEALELSVSADLRVNVLEQPTTTNFYYGNQITFRVEVTDANTGNYVRLGSRGGVYLGLVHRDQNRDRTYTSTKQAGIPDGDSYVISWEINPNAVSGPSTITLFAEGADGSEVALLQESGKAFSLAVNIGGDIKEEVTVYSSSDYFSTRTAFVVQFGLFCNNVPLKDVKLRAVVLYNGKAIETLTVGASDEQYVASWTSEHDASPSGTYTVEIYREADQLRAAESEEWKLKQLRAKQREAELSGTAFDEAKFLASLGDVSVEPLFTVTVPHKEVTRGGLPIKIEVLLGLGVIGAWLYFDNLKRRFNNIPK